METMGAVQPKKNSGFLKLRNLKYKFAFMKKIIVAVTLVAGVAGIAVASMSSNKRKTSEEKKIEKKVEKKKKECRRSCSFI